MSTDSVVLPSAGLDDLFDWITLSCLAALLCCALFILPSIGQAQTPTPITQSGLNTQVNLSATPPAGHVQYDITGGTRPGGGTNLFHSFGDFNVPTNNIANFLNSGSVDLSGALLPQNLPTSNILARVTDVNPSTIFGTIQTNGMGGFGNANLFLMNPHGFLFGPNATVNVGGMMTFTTADYLRFQGTDTLFNKVSTPESLSLLSTVPVAAFGFLGSNPAAITIQGSTLQVAQGQSLSFVGGNQGFKYIDPDTGNRASIPGGVTMTGGTLSAPGGQINLASVASAGEMLSSNLQLGANVNGESFTSLGSITISQDARIDTAGTTGGTIAIRGGQLTIRDGATIASTVSSSPLAPAGSVTINGTGVQMTGSDVVINGTNVSVTGSKVTAANLDGSGGTIVITAGSADHLGKVTVAQNALLNASGTSGGSITIRGKQLVVDNATISADTGNADGALVAIDIDVTGAVSLSNISRSALTARTSGAGNAGDIVISSGSLTATFGTDAFDVSLIDSHTMGSGHGGNVTINTNTGPLSAIGTLPQSGNFIESGTGADGNGGNVTITAGDAQFKSVIIDTGFTTFEGSGSGGSLTVTAQSLVLDNVSWGTDSLGIAGAIHLESAGLLQITGNSFITNLSLLGNNPITIIADRFVLDNTHVLATTVFEDGGDVSVASRIVDFSNGGLIGTETQGDGHAGNIIVRASERLSFIDDPRSFAPSGLYTTSLGGAGNLGKAGNITVDTPRLELINGARINASTFTSGQGGNVTITNANSVLISGERSLGLFEELVQGGTRASGVYTNTQGTGAGGDIFVNANTVTLQNGGTLSAATSGTEVTATGGTITVDAANTVTMNSASITASSTGTADAGSINITSLNGFTMQNSTITTQAGQGAGGGNIKVTTSPAATVWLQNSTISASVADGPGGGGNISIDPQFVILQNSQILAQAAQGQGGAITITASLFLPDANSIVNADSGSGVNGTVTIQSPNAPGAGEIQPLGKTPLIATSLLNQRCASLAGGEFSSFTVAGRDSLPTEPGSWLASPLATLDAGMGLGVKAEGGKAEGMSASAGQVASGQWRVGDTPILSLRQIAPAGFLTQAFAVDEPTGCQS